MDKGGKKNFEDFLKDSNNMAENYSPPKDLEFDPTRFKQLSMKEQICSNN